MDNRIETVILTTRPSIKTISVGIVGTIFFGAFVYLMLKSLLASQVTVTGVDYKTGITIVWVVLGAFVFFSAYSLWTVLYIKTIDLTYKNLIIKRPLLLLRKNISLANIKKITEKDFEVNSYYRWTSFNVYTGKQITINCKNGKSIKLNSYEIPDLRLLTSKLNKLLRSNEKLKFEGNEDIYQNKYSGYGWLIFILILTFGLVYSLIKGQL